MIPDTELTHEMWFSFVILCDICSETWAGVAPVGAVEAECPACGHMCDVPDGERYARLARENKERAEP